MPGWGNYTPRKKTKTAASRSQLAKKFPSEIDELIAIAAKCKKKPKVLPPGPHPDDDVIRDEPEKVVGPCQLHCDAMKAWRVAKKAQGAVVAETKS